MGEQLKLRVWHHNWSHFIPISALGDIIFVSLDLGALGAGLTRLPITEERGCLSGERTQLLLWQENNVFSSTQHQVTEALFFLTADFYLFKGPLVLCSRMLRKDATCNFEKFVVKEVNHRYSIKTTFCPFILNNHSFVLLCSSIIVLITSKAHQQSLLSWVFSFMSVFFLQICYFS